MRSYWAISFRWPFGFRGHRWVFVRQMTRERALWIGRHLWRLRYLGARHFQVEEGRFPSSIIPTQGEPVTRSPDRMSFNIHLKKGDPFAYYRWLREIAGNGWSPNPEGRKPEQGATESTTVHDRNPSVHNKSYTESYSLVVGEIAVRLGKDGKLKTGYRLWNGPWKDADDLFARGDAESSTPPLSVTDVSGFVRGDA